VPRGRNCQSQQQLGVWRVKQSFQWLWYCIGVCNDAAAADAADEAVEKQDTLVCMLEDKPHPNFNGLLCSTCSPQSAKNKCSQITRYLIVRSQTTWAEALGSSFCAWKNKKQNKTKKTNKKKNNAARPIQRIGNWHEHQHSLSYPILMFCFRCSLLNTTTCCFQPFTSTFKRMTKTMSSNRHQSSSLECM